MHGAHILSSLVCLWPSPSQKNSTKGLCCHAEQSRSKSSAQSAGHKLLPLPSPRRKEQPHPAGGGVHKVVDPATLAQIAATHPLVRTVESGEEPLARPPRPSDDRWRVCWPSTWRTRAARPWMWWLTCGRAKAWATRQESKEFAERPRAPGRRAVRGFCGQMAPMRDVRQAEANADLLIGRRRSPSRIWKGRTRRRGASSPRTSSCWRRDQLQREHDAAVAFRARYSFAERDGGPRGARRLRGARRRRGRLLPRVGNAPTPRRTCAGRSRTRTERKRRPGSTSSCPRATRAGLLAKLDGAAAAYRKLFEFAASSLGRGAATATDAAQKAASSEAAATGARHRLDALQALTRRRALYAACRDACGASRRALCVARLKETLAERGAAGARPKRRTRRARERFGSVDAPDFSDGGGRRARFVWRRRPEGARERGRRGARAASATDRATSPTY